MEIIGGMDGSSGLGSSRLVSLNDAPHRAQFSIRFDQVRILANRLLSLSTRHEKRQNVERIGMQTTSVIPSLEFIAQALGLSELLHLALKVDVRDTSARLGPPHVAVTTYQ